jgi:hydroxymethylpyrimidine pyrophosphatase-like HAD family hydrolase
MIIAIDFDGTIVEHQYPEIGRIRPFAFETLQALQSKKHRLILWTHRSGQLLEEAVEFCRANGIEFYAVNKNYPEETWSEHDSRKIFADMYIDDRNLGGIPSWGEIFQAICPEQILITEPNSRSWWKM